MTIGEHSDSSPEFQPVSSSTTQMPLKKAFSITAPVILPSGRKAPTCRHCGSRTLGHSELECEEKRKVTTDDDDLDSHSPLDTKPRSISTITSNMSRAASESKYPSRKPDITPRTVHFEIPKPQTSSLGLARQPEPKTVATVNLPRSDRDSDAVVPVMLGQEPMLVVDCSSDEDAHSDRSCSSSAVSGVLVDSEGQGQGLEGSSEEQLELCRVQNGRTLRVGSDSDTAIINRHGAAGDHGKQTRLGIQTEVGRSSGSSDQPKESPSGPWLNEITITLRGVKLYVLFTLASFLSGVFTILFIQFTVYVTILWKVGSWDFSESLNLPGLQTSIAIEPASTTFIQELDL
ncbi:hypothetical protein FA15DRAFT_658681 [Coprinopsis marcescibilis]|uniref:Uncharacterized protein n=1 Tax=Coprinopsis marcescibilis TaxID=230819 RepID=A0A5C3KYL0_COPMA|nr:hypothetical protein FA15DRAFT_658681 [Coprinopsis marcescibilis]